MTRATFRKIWKSIAGGAVILAGIIMFVIPGPGVVVVAMGVAILATEFPWARRLVVRAKDWGHRRLPDFIAKRIHMTDDDKELLAGRGKKPHAPAAD